MGHGNDERKSRPLPVRQISNIGQKKLVINATNFGRFLCLNRTPYWTVLKLNDEKWRNFDEEALGSRKSDTEYSNVRPTRSSKNGLEVIRWRPGRKFPLIWNCRANDNFIKNEKVRFRRTRVKARPKYHYNRELEHYLIKENILHSESLLFSGYVDMKILCE